jgi:hypothetical protein
LYASRGDKTFHPRIAMKRPESLVESHQLRFAVQKTAPGTASGCLPPAGLI